MSVESRVAEIIAPLLAEEDYELVDVKYRPRRGGAVLTIYIDHPLGVKLTDCEAVSRKIEPYLDLYDPIPGRYYLEVSSPGLDRPLKKESDYQRFQGKKAVVRTFAPFEGKKEWRGRLGGVKEGKVVLWEGEQAREIPLELISSAQLEPEFEGEFKR